MLLSKCYPSNQANRYRKSISNVSFYRNKRAATNNKFNIGPEAPRCLGWALKRGLASANIWLCNIWLVSIQCAFPCNSIILNRFHYYFFFFFSSFDSYIPLLANTETCKKYTENQGKAFYKLCCPLANSGLQHLLTTIMSKQNVLCTFCALGAGFKWWVSVPHTQTNVF